jgi:hypothetical protein
MTLHMFCKQSGIFEGVSIMKLKLLSGVGNLISLIIKLSINKRANEE